MIRDSSTYRAERRNAWRDANSAGEVKVPWRLYNVKQPGVDHWHIGSMRAFVVTIRKRIKGKFYPYASTKRGPKKDFVFRYTT